jgi:hypothetical protein
MWWQAVRIIGPNIIMRDAAYEGNVEHTCRRVLAWDDSRRIGEREAREKVFVAR